MKITKGDKLKRVLDVAIWWFLKNYKDEKGKRPDLYEDMQHCGNPIINKIYKKVFKKMLSHYHPKAKHQVEEMDEIGTFIFWILYKDTAYRQPAMWALRELFKMKDELMPLLDEVVVEPKEWFANAWIESKEITQKLVEEGEIVKGEFSGAESFFVPEIQQARFSKMEADFKKDRRKNRNADAKKK